MIFLLVYDAWNSMKQSSFQVHKKRQALGKIVIFHYLWFSFPHVQTQEWKSFNLPVSSYADLKKKYMLWSGFLPKKCISCSRGKNVY